MLGRARAARRGGVERERWFAFPRFQAHDAASIVLVAIATGRFRFGRVLPMSVRLADCKSTVKSQHGQDGVVAAVFREIGVSSRTCVEFGAFDLQRFSNVFPLWTNGWKCLLIEGDAERHRKLVSDFAAYPGSAELRVSIANAYVQEA